MATVANKKESTAASAIFIHHDHFSFHSKQKTNPNKKPMTAIASPTNGVYPAPPPMKNPSKSPKKPTSAPNSGPSKIPASDTAEMVKENCTNPKGMEVTALTTTFTANKIPIYASFALRFFPTSIPNKKRLLSIRKNLPKREVRTLWQNASTQPCPV